MSLSMGTFKTGKDLSGMFGMTHFFARQAPVKDKKRKVLKSLRSQHQLTSNQSNKNYSLSHSINWCLLKLNQLRWNPTFSIATLHIERNIEVDMIPFNSYLSKLHLSNYSFGKDLKPKSRLLLDLLPNSLITISCNRLDSPSFNM